MNRKLLLFAALLLAPASAVPAQRTNQAGAQQQQRPELFEALVRCRAVTEDAARLRCFDAASAALEQATERRDVVVVDRAQVRETRRRLFGLALPSLAIFGGGDDARAEEEEVSSIEGVIASAQQNDLGQWYIRLQEGGLWVQTDHNTLALQPRAGQNVVIHRGVMGSYMMQVSRQPGIRVRRQN